MAIKKRLRKCIELISQLFSEDKKAIRFDDFRKIRTFVVSRLGLLGLMLRVGSSARCCPGLLAILQPRHFPFAGKARECFNGAS